jgi:phenylacetate-coenzyme A ligase PaaK-like adenylate-forming protein
MVKRLEISTDNLARATRDWLSVKALVPSMYLLQMARPSIRPGRSVFFKGMRFRREAAPWCLERKMEWILQRLRFSVRRAYRETIYYRELFDRIGFDPLADFSFEDFSLLPVLGREEVHRAGQRLVSNCIPPDRLRRDATGGSSGTPTEIWMGPEERGWRESSGETFMQRLGLPTGTRIGYFWGHHLDPLMTDSLRAHFHCFVNNTRTFNCFRLSPEVFESYHQEFKRWRPTCIVAYAAALGHLAEYLLERGYRPNYPSRCLVTGAEKLIPHHRQLIEAAFGRPVHERYGSRDVGYIAYQMDPAQSHDFEIDWADLLLEPEAEGPESSILITKLHADGMPMIRYRIDDVGRFPEGSSPGYPTFALHEILGRVTDGVWLHDGRWVHGIEFPHMMKDYPIREFMLLQRPDYSVQLMIVPKNGFGEESRRRIENIVKANLPGLDLKIEMVEQVPRTMANKWRPVVSEVKFTKGESR